MCEILWCLVILSDERAYQVPGDYAELKGANLSNTCRYEVFLSHANVDKDVVELIADRLLRGTQLQPFLDQWHLVPGEPWQEALEDALNHSRTCAVFLGSTGMGPWEHEEMRAALDQRVRNPDFRVIPVLLPKARMPERGRLPAFLARLTWVDFRQNIDDDQAFHRLVCGIKGTMPGRSVSPEVPDQIVCPYRGLESFQENHAEFFFGRNALIQWMQEVLRGSRFLGIVGPSGSGKSSVVRAGLIPALREGKIPGSANWKTIVLIPGPRPLEELAAHLTKFGSADNQIAQMMSVQDSLRNDSRTLHSAVRLAFTDAEATTRILIVVDQCEELFTLCNDETERKRFLDNLLYASSIAEGRTVVVFVLRADFYSRAAAYPELADAMSDHQILVTPMTSDELRLAIEAPATSVGLSFDEGLVDTILNDIVDQPAALPLLEHALRQLWEQRQGQRLTLEAYRKIGGVGGAIARRAEYEYAELAPEQQAVAQMLLLRLVQPGEGTEDTRRRVYLSELIIGSDPTPVFSVVVQRLVEARLVTIGQDTASGKEQLYVAHEALIRGWPRLRAWLDEDRDALRQHRRLTQRAQEWERLGREQESLLGGAQLAEAETWAKAHGAQMNELERAFLESSTKRAKSKIAEAKSRQQRELEAARQLAEEAETRRRVQRRAVFGLAVGFVIALVLAGFAGFQWFRAERQAHETDAARQEMQEQTKLSQARQLAAQSEWVPQGSALAGLLAIESLKRVPTLEGYRAWEKSLALLPKLVRRISHSSPVDAVSFSSNSRYLATITLDQKITAYELPSARVVDDIPVHGQLWRASLKSDGKLVSQATSSAFQLKTLNGSDSTSQVGPGIITPDGQWLLTGNSDGTLKLKEIKSGQTVIPTGEPIMVGGRRSPFIFSADGRLLAETNDRLLTIWKLEDGRVSNKLNPLGIRKVSNDLLMTFSADGEYLTIGGTGSLGLIDTDKGRLIYALPGAASATLDGAVLRTFSVTKGSQPNKREDIKFLVKKIQPGGAADTAGLKEGDTIEKANNIALSASPTDNAWLQNFRPGDEITLQVIREGKKMEITARLGRDNVDIDVLLFSSDGRKIFTANQDAIWIWDTLTGNEVSRIFSKKTVMDISADGERIVTGSVDGEVRIWDTSNGRELVRMIHEDAVRSVLFSPDSKFLATGSDDKTAKVWNIANGKELTRIVHDEIVSGAMFSPDQNWFLTVSEGNTLLWEIFPRLKLHQFIHDADVRTLAFSADGHWLATAGNDKVARVWDIASGSLIARLEHDDSIDDIWFDPDQQQLLTVSGKHLWRWKTNPFGELDKVVEANKKTFRPAERKMQSETATTEIMSIDGRYRAVGSIDGEIRVFENATGREASVLSQQGRLTAMTFSPDNQWLATASSGGLVQLRLWRPEDLTAEACTHLIRDMSPKEWRRYSGNEQRSQICPGLPVPTDASGPKNKLDAAFTNPEVFPDPDTYNVDCHLHSSVRQITQSIYDTIRWRSLKTTNRNCADLGGEYVVYDRASYATALKIWLPKAKEGDAEAQTYVGEIYEKGLGIAPDYQLAASWYQKAADQGYSQAQINLGYLYEKGLGVPKNLEIALNWYRKASGLTSKDVVPADTVLIEAISASYSDLDFGHYHALIIGNQLYSSLASVDTAENDAHELSKLLAEQYGFETKLLVNANRYTILSALNKFRKKLTEKDNFLLYFTGHSQLDTNKKAYWLPVDADSDDTANWISTTAITDVLGGMTAKHIIVLVDALFPQTETGAESLVKFEASSVENQKTQLQQFLNRRSRTVLMSGGSRSVNDVNSKYSLFGQALLETLEHHKGILTGSMLYREVAERFETRASKTVVDYEPDYSRIRFTNDALAPFFFVNKGPYSTKAN